MLQSNYRVPLTRFQCSEKVSWGNQVVFFRGYKRDLRWQANCSSSCKPSGCCWLEYNATNILMLGGKTRGCIAVRTIKCHSVFDRNETAFIDRLPWWKKRFCSTFLLDVIFYTSPFYFLPWLEEKGITIWHYANNMKVFTNHREKSSCNRHKLQLNPSKDPMFTHFQ